MGRDLHGLLKRVLRFPCAAKGCESGRWVRSRQLQALPGFFLSMSLSFPYENER